MQVKQNHGVFSLLPHAETENRINNPLTDFRLYSREQFDRGRDKELQRWTR